MKIKVSWTNFLNLLGAESVSLWTHVSHFDVFMNVQQLLFDLRPHAVRYVHPGAGRTLLTSVLKRRANRPHHHALNVCRPVDKVEILPAAL